MSKIATLVSAAALALGLAAGSAQAAAGQPLGTGLTETTKDSGLTQAGYRCTWTYYYGQVCRWVPDYNCFVTYEYRYNWYYGTYVQVPVRRCTY